MHDEEIMLLKMSRRLQFIKQSHRNWATNYVEQFKHSLHIVFNVFCEQTNMLLRSSACKHGCYHQSYYVCTAAAEYLKDELVGTLICNRVAFLVRTCKESLNPPMGLPVFKWRYAAEMS